MAFQSKIQIKASDYYQLPDYQQHNLIELIDGEVIIGVPPIPRHQQIVGEILFLFMTIAKEKDGRAFTSPIEVYLDESNVFEPDVLYLVSDTDCQIESKRLSGAPDLVVEVLSPATAKYDRQEKYQAYEKHGVSEYWIADPVHEILEVWTLENKQFKRQGAYGKDDGFESKVLGRAVDVNGIFEE